MNADEPQPDEASILTRLLACEEALAAGKPEQRAAGSETPVDLQPRLEGDLACIQVLRQVLPRRPAGVTPPTPISETSAPLLVETPVPPTTDSEAPVPPETSGTDISPDADLPFQELGRFQLRRKLGQGAFGMVFLAADPKLGRAVALKVPRPEALLTGNLRERFVREARAAAGLDHPNVVPVYEAGAVGPLCYIASAYCPGITLADWIKERSELAPERLAAALVATLADAVSHAHGRGVIHRDLKPSNILLQAQSRDSTDPHSTVQDPSARLFAGAEGDFLPRITDFGLAKLTADAPAPTEEGGAETRTGAVLGTPNYMAPEQASGKNKEVGPSADIYALGAILYELLTGRPPFRGESVLDTLEQVRSRDPMPPGRLRPKLARDLETICLKCLQKEPHKRYESAGSLVDDLRRYLAGEPIQARPIRAWERGIKWARRKPAQAMLLAAAMALVAVVLGYSVALAHSNKQLKKSNEDLGEALVAKNKALVAKDEALDAKDKALTEEEKQRRRAEAGELKARNFSYVSDMNLSQHDWASARVKRLRELLQRQIPERDALDLRGFEWHYWDRLANHSARLTLEGHTREVLCVACSPDGKLLASGSSDGTVRLWDTTTGRELHTFDQFGFPVTAVAFAEGGRTLAVASNQSVSVFDVESHKLRKVFPRRRLSVMAVAIAGERIALALNDRSLEIWELGKQAPLRIPPEHKELVQAIAFSADGRTLASGDDDGILLLWETATGKRLASCISPRPRRIQGIAFAPDGKRLAAAGHDGTLRLWDLSTAKELILTGHAGEVLSVQFAADGKTLVSTGADSTVRLWNTDGSPRSVFKGHTDKVSAAVFTPDGRTIVSAGDDRRLYLWNADRAPDPSSWQTRQRIVRHLAFTPKGDVLAVGGGDGSVKFWDRATHRQFSAVPSYPRPIQNLAFAEDGKHLVVACLDRFVHICDRQTGKEVEKLAGHTDNVTAVAFSADGKMLASGQLGGSIRIWDWQTRKTIAEHANGRLRIRALAFSPDGKLVAFGGDRNGTVHLWAPATGQLRTLLGHSAIIRSLGFSADGGTLASGSEDKAIILWDVGSGNKRMVLSGHAGAVRSLAFSPDGRTLASSSGEAMKLWQVATGRELADFRDRSIWSVAWEPHGYLLAGGGEDGVITYWDAGTERMKKER